MTGWQKTYFILAWAMVAGFGIELALTAILDRGLAGVAFALLYLMAARYCWWRFRANRRKRGWTR